MNIETLTFIRQVLLEERDRRVKAWNDAKQVVAEKTRIAEEHFARDGFADIAATGAVERANNAAAEAFERQLDAKRAIINFEAHEWR